MVRRLAYFGGTFDPVHNGHVEIARAAGEPLGVDCVTFVPAACPPHKGRAQASAADRLAMLRLATADEAALDICELELHREGPSYTHDTLTALAEEAGPSVRLCWIVGADMLADLPGWHRARDVVELADVVTVVRRPWHERLEAIFQTLSRTFTAEQIARLREGVVQTPLIDISSTEIRRRAAAGESVADLVHPDVSRYIADHGLYRDGG